MSGLDESTEKLDDVFRRLAQIRERWDNKLSFPLSKLGERYLRGDLSILLYCSSRDGEIGSREPFVLSICQNVGDDVEARAGRKGEVGATCDNHQLPVFIKSVHVVDDAKGIVGSIRPSLVRLQSLNQGANAGIRNALYFSVVSAQFIFRRQLAEDRELKDVLVSSPCGIAGKVPDEVVGTRPQVMDNLASQHTETFGEFQVSMIVNRFLPALVVCIGEDWVFADLKKSEDFLMEIEDVLVGPF